MKAHAALVLAAAAALAAASPAAAKGRVDVTICGAAECVEIHAVDGSERGSALAFGLLSDGGSFRFAPAPPAGPWYSVVVDADWFGRPRTMAYADGLLGTGTNWIHPAPPVATSLKRLTRDLEPRPAVRLRSVTVDGKQAADPAAYDVLLGDLPLAPAPGSLGDRIQIRLTGDAVTQWADPDWPLAYVPETRTLRRASRWVRVPDDLAAVIAADAGRAPARPATATSASGFPAADLAAALAVLAAAGVAVLAVSRRRRRSRAT